MRLIQVHALDRLIELVDVLGRAAGARQDPFSVERAAERRLDASVLPLAELAPGYEHNRDAAIAMLDVLEGLAPVDARMAGAIRELAG